MKKILSMAGLWVAAAVTAACSTPASHFYTLSQTSAGNATAVASNVTVMVGPVSIPAIVDVPEIVVSTGPNQVRQDEFNRWASPLANNITRVVVGDLVSLLGTPHVSAVQDAVELKPDYQVAIAVQTFESAPGTSATLGAIWTVRRTRDDKAESGRTDVSESAGEKGYDALVAAHSRALGRLSQDIADRIRSMERSTP
jgi:uncharacterized lipoprotein YmbA